MDRYRVRRLLQPVSKEYVSQQSHCISSIKTATVPSGAQTEPLRNLRADGTDPPSQVYPANTRDSARNRRKQLVGQPHNRGSLCSPQDHSSDMRRSPLRQIILRCMTATTQASLPAPQVQSPNQTVRHALSITFKRTPTINATDNSERSATRLAPVTMSAVAERQQYFPAFRTTLLAIYR